MIRSKYRLSYGSKSKSSSLLTLNEIDALEKSMDWRKYYIVKPKEIGRGHFSKVFLVTNETNDISYAAKVIRRRKGGIDRLDKIRKEAEIIRKLNDKKIMSVIQLIETHESFSEVVLICEIANGGSLFTLIQDSDSGLNQDYVKCVIYKILLALESMHAINIVHLDIKADNILLREPYPSTNIAICDFGLATELKKGINHKELVGTPDYMAPEVVNYEKITFNADMWSVGVLTYHLLTQISPFMGQSKDETLINVSKVRIAFDSIFNQQDFLQAKDFISSLCKKSPNIRLTSSTAQNHKWLNNITDLDIDYPLDATQSSYVNTRKSQVFNSNLDNHRSLPLSNGHRCQSVNLKSLDLNSNFHLDIPDSPFLYSSESCEANSMQNVNIQLNDNFFNYDTKDINDNHMVAKKRDLSNVDEVADESPCDIANVELKEIPSRNRITINVMNDNDFVNDSVFIENEPVNDKMELKDNNNDSNICVLKNMQNQSGINDDNAYVESKTDTRVHIPVTDYLTSGIISAENSDLSDNVQPTGDTIYKHIISPKIEGNSDSENIHSDTLNEKIAITATDGYKKPDEAIDLDVHTNISKMISKKEAQNSNLLASAPLDLDDYDNISESYEDNIPVKIPSKRETSSSSSFFSCESEIDSEENSKYTSLLTHLRLSELCILL